MWAKTHALLRTYAERNGGPRKMMEDNRAVLFGNSLYEQHLVYLALYDTFGELTPRLSADNSRAEPRPRAILCPTPGPGPAAVDRGGGISPAGHPIRLWHEHELALPCRECESHVSSSTDPSSPNSLPNGRTRLHPSTPHTNSPAMRCTKSWRLSPSPPSTPRRHRSVSSSATSSSATRSSATCSVWHLGDQPTTLWYSAAQRPSWSFLPRLRSTPARW